MLWEGQAASTRELRKRCKISDEWYQEQRRRNHGELKKLLEKCAFPGSATCCEEGLTCSYESSACGAEKVCKIKTGGDCEGQWFGTPCARYGPDKGIDCHKVTVQEGGQEKEKSTWNSALGFQWP